jgi:hypothetical protein
MEVLLFIVSICVFIELTFGFETNPEKKLYNYLFRPKVFFICTFICLLIALVGLKSFDGGNDKLVIGSLIPLHYILLFKTVDVISNKVNGRHIIIAARNDYRAPEHSWVDTLLCVILLFASMTLPIFEVLFLLPKRN